jgi:hypothetical protein
MSKNDTRVDAYIARSAPFAKPILTHLRKLIHANCPSVEETIKWGFPHFMYKGPADRQPRVLCSMASFKAHCAFGFWHPEMRGALGGDGDGDHAMGQFGRIAALSDLPKDKVLAGYITQAIKLHDAGRKPAPRARPAEKKELVLPPYFAAALKKNKKALATFEQFNYTNKKDYVEWITEAKSEATRLRRLDTAIEWLSEGKVRNWKYIR